MAEDKRSHEASGLRAFFDDQIRLLQELVDNFSSHIHIESRQTEEDRQIVEKFVDSLNRKMRSVNGYSPKLREHIRALYSHVLQVADEIPPPVDLNLDAFRTDPLINAMFVNSKDIDKLFKTDPDVDILLRTHSKFQVPLLYALLTATKSENRTLGVGMLGDMLIHEVPQQTVNFSSHKIHTPCANSAELSTGVKKYLLDSVVAFVKQEMTSRMTHHPFKSRDDSYELLVKSLANPDIYLGEIIEYLKTPADLLSIDKTHFKLSKLGIKLDGDDRQCANEFDIHELVWLGHTRNVALQVTYAPLSAIVPQRSRLTCLVCANVQIMRI